ncbi:MAG: sugar phosphate nucleotidyltransferase, partial [Caulobacteraceae bacterium]
VLVAACDHHIADGAAFAAGVAAALAAAREGAIVTFGVRPAAPSTAYGYIRPGAPLAGGARAVDAFVEKPDAESARALVAEGCLWNSGNFVFQARTMLAELEAREPALLAAARRARAEGRRDGDLLELSKAFLAAPSLAIDVAVMERTNRAAVLPIAYTWSDLGAWDAVLDAAEKDDAGNATRGEVKLVDSRDCLVRAGAGARVVVIGLEGVAVVVEDGRVLVTDLASAQKVRAAAEGIDPD